MCHIFTCLISLLDTYKHLIPCLYINFVEAYIYMINCSDAKLLDKSTIHPPTGMITVGLCMLLFEFVGKIFFHYENTSQWLSK